jgi:hypothetical protein
MNGLRLLSLLVLIAIGVTMTAAQLVTGRLATSFYAWERFDSVGTSQQTIRAFQAVQLSIAQGDVSLHTSLMGTTNVTGEFGDAGRVRLYNLYLSWLNIGKSVDLHLGRQYVYAGVGNGSIDGILAQAHFLQRRITVTGFGGATVSPEFTDVRKNMHDNYHFGGQVVTSLISNARIGISYANRREERDPYWALRARDTSFTPVPYQVMSDAEAEELGSADASYTLQDRLTVYGRYDYDFKNERTSRAQGSVRVNVTNALALTGDYMHRLPRISFNSIFSAFVTNAVDEVEGGVEYGFTPMLRAFGRVAGVSYSDEKSTRWTLGVNSAYGSASYSGSDGYAGELQAFSVQGTYPFFGKLLVPMAGFSYSSYRLSKESEQNSAIGVMVGAIVRPARAFSFDVQGQWLNNRLMQRDMRLQVKLNYWFAERLSIFNGEGKQ